MSEGLLWGLSPAALGWLRKGALLAHIAAVVVWFGAVSYYLLILRPAMAVAGLEREVKYALLIAIKARLRRVVGMSVVVLVLTGVLLAWLRGYWGGGVGVSSASALFHMKLGVVGLLILIFLTALPLLARVRRSGLRGRLFIGTHVVVLLLGAAAAALGVLISP